MKWLKTSGLESWRRGHWRTGQVASEWRSDVDGLGRVDG